MNDSNQSSVKTKWWIWQTSEVFVKTLDLTQRANILKWQVWQVRKFLRLLKTHSWATFTSFRWKSLLAPKSQPLRNTGSSLIYLQMRKVESLLTLTFLRVVWMWKKWRLQTTGRWLSRQQQQQKSPGSFWKSTLFFLRFVFLCLSSSFVTYK